MILPVWNNKGDNTGSKPQRQRLEAITRGLERPTREMDDRCVLHSGKSNMNSPGHVTCCLNRISQRSHYKPPSHLREGRLEASAPNDPLSVERWHSPRMLPRPLGPPSLWATEEATHAPPGSEATHEHMAALLAGVRGNALISLSLLLR